MYNNKISEDEYADLLESRSDPDSPPKLVLPAPRLFDDLKMLETLFLGNTPAVFPIRFSSTAEVFYGFFDASGTGLGSMFQGKDETVISIRIGTWSCTISEERSSNWKEFGNVVKAIRSEAKKGRLTDSLVFIFTDNSTLEGVVAKGNSPSEYLFELVLDLRRCQVEYRFGLYAILVSGKRMIQQGTDGVSRGDLQLAGKLVTPIRSFAPIHLTSVERSPAVEE